MCVVIHAAKIIHKKGKMQIIGGKITILFVFFIACPARTPCPAAMGASLKID